MFLALLSIFCLWDWGGSHWLCPGWNGTSRSFCLCLSNSCDYRHESPT
jgi:hypothetical protein